MLDQFLKRDDVLCFIKKIRTSERYFQKKKESYMNLPFYVGDEIALYVFYEALLKYKIIIDDIYLFDEYLEQLEKLYRKLDNIEDIIVGINRLIVRMVASKLGLKSTLDDLSRKTIISYVYNRYILDGYLIHGFNATYYRDIEENGFVPEVYENYYTDFIELNKVFAKYGVEKAIVKDFFDNKVYFTDDIVLACYYSKYAPLFFYEFLNNQKSFRKKRKKAAFSEDDFANLVKSLKKKMSEMSFNESDRDFVNKLVEKQWDLLHRKNTKKIGLLLVKTSKIFNRDSVSLEDFMDDDNELEEVIDRLLSSKNNSVHCSDKLENQDIELVMLDDYIWQEVVKEKEDCVDTSSYSFDGLLNRDILDAYGRASVLLILGSLFISLGVIVTIFMILGGM